MRFSPGGLLLLLLPQAVAHRRHGGAGAATSSGAFEHGRHTAASDFPISCTNAATATAMLSDCRIYTFIRIRLIFQVQPNSKSSEQQNLITNSEKVHYRATSYIPPTLQKIKVGMADLNFEVRV